MLFHCAVAAKCSKTLTSQSLSLNVCHYGEWQVAEIMCLTVPRKDTDERDENEPRHHRLQIIKPKEQDEIHIVELMQSCDKSE